MRTICQGKLRMNIIFYRGGEKRSVRIYMMNQQTGMRLHVLQRGYRFDFFIEAFLSVGI